MNNFFAEPLSYDENQKIIGGFSMAFGFAGANPHCGDTTTPKHTKNTNSNCAGGNCKPGCYNPSKIKKIDTLHAINNCMQNCAKGCKNTHP
jgi:hypothetical protein